MPKNNRIIAALMSIAAAFSLLVMFIPEAVSSADNTTSLVCISGNKPIAGIQWKIYHIGEVRDNEYVLTGDYEDYPVNLTDLTSENIGGTAKALESFVLGYDLPHLSVADTDENGTVTFSALETGLYLAVAKSVKIEHNLYKANPLLFEVKAGDTDENTIFPKMYSNSTLAGMGSYYTVKKVWVDNEDGARMRPVDVTVDLYKDGELADTVTLNLDNGWEYKWENIDPEAEWRVVEREIPVKYEVIVDYNSTQYLIKNTYNPSRKTGGGYGTRTTMTTTSTTTATTTTTVTTAALQTTEKKSTLPPRTTATSTSEPKLPQTGQLWWPVVPLSAGGLVFITIGLALPKRKENEE
ncbi:MAG: Cna B-type domain-containing protein [Ruminococcus sp.]|nr:Cna B-type domain-containing protein [Ruminococcus sp.]